jgi:hypothetical protein
LYIYSPFCFKEEEEKFLFLFLFLFFIVGASDVTCVVDYDLLLLVADSIK